MVARPERGRSGQRQPVLFFFLFPSGRFVPHWTRWLAVAFIVNDVPNFLFLQLYSRSPSLETVSYLVFLGA